MSSKSSFAVIIPCYNEEKAIPTFLNEATDFFKSFESELKSCSLKFVFVDNNSTDDSFKLLEQFAAENKSSVSVSVIRCDVQGYGAALKKGFCSTEAHWFGFADLDNTYPLKNFIQMIQLAEQKKLDIVFANRLQLRSDMPFVRKVGNLFYSLISDLIFKDSVKDMCTGMRVFTTARKEQIVSLKSDDLKFSIEFTATSLKSLWPKAEIPILYRERIGPSKLSVVKDGILFLFILLKVKLSGS